MKVEAMTGTEMVRKWTEKREKTSAKKGDDRKEV